MAKSRLLLGSVALAGALVTASAEASSSSPPAPHALRASRNLWATIDVCNPARQRDTVGIRGSMPGDGQPGDTMFMRFRLQFVDTHADRWVDLAGASSEYFAVGNARSARQAGRSFVLVPPTRGSAFKLRGVVNYQWRHGSRVLSALSRTTSAGHESLAGADPPNFSAATCQIS
jgi:hypothetical protein